MEEKTIFNSRSLSLREAETHTKELALSIQSDRPYVIPKGYMRWGEACLSLAFAMDATETVLLNKSYRGNDLATWLHFNRSLIWLSHNSPLYLVDNELLKMVSKTDLPTGQNSLLKGLLDRKHPGVKILRLLDMCDNTYPKMSRWLAGDDQVWLWEEFSKEVKGRHDLQEQAIAAVGQ